ncbi:alpha/beta fold hydrolase [Rhodanobacter glycinis]|jgi:pimeloyl-ACP methyl ester carboxylesterase|uniref:Pimeloyl-ACP methyl ester carboxylesterase n=1 Tax=Rhodanobacter glycinis TaxID=582702 RepID=A0A1I4C420_9GAMM|nr:alpha/beta hydrolase [Rhodanobacter glycinis]SFK75069.1 Pimeloyl-ACP methyl ester carboxylesterase [Rhodanobacter glycinis]
MNKMHLKAGSALLLVMAFCQTQATEASHATATQRMPDSYAQAAKLIDLGHGRHLNLRCSGNGPQTVLLEAGALADSSTWFKVQPLLAAHARVCAYDRAGFGFSSEGPLPRNLDADVSDLHALIQRAGLATPLVMVGHSLGSNIVRQYASRYPENVSAMVLLDPPAQDIGRFAPGWQKDEDTLSVQRFAFLRQCEAAAEKHELTSTNKELSQCLGGPDPHASAKLNAVNLALMSKPAYWHTVLSVLQNNPAIFKPPVSKQETHGATPLIVLSAANTYADALPRDRKGLEEARAHTQAQIVATSSRGTLVHVADTSHDIQIDQPNAVAKAVMQALKMAKGDANGRQRGRSEPDRG